MKLRVDVSDGKNVLFISDFHLFHKNVIKFDNRPFVTDNGEADLKTMHDTIIKNWNSVVSKNDVVFYLGDLIFGRKEWADDILKQLNGKIHFIMGNHDDYKEIVSHNRFETISDLVDLKITGADKEYAFVLCHYPIYSWNKIHHGSFMVHGHCHMSLSNLYYHKNNRIIDVGCNGWDYTPVSYTKIIEILDKINYKLGVGHH